MLRQDTHLNPILIFGEDHYDPITGKILARLCPKLQSLGYKCFFDEMPKGPTLENQIKALENDDQLYQELNKQFNECGLTINNDSDLEKFVLQTLAKQSITNTYIINNMLPQLLVSLNEVIKRHQPGLSFRIFLNSLITNQIGYQAIDLEIVTTHVSASEALPFIGIRDKYLADAYLSTQQSVFGRIGLYHTKGIQEKILNKLPYEQALTKFCFFNIYSNPPLPIMDNFEEKVRNGKIIFPLGIIPINAATKSEDEVVEIILKEIIKRQEKLRELEKTDHFQTNHFLVAQAKSKPIYDRLDTSLPSLGYDFSILPTMFSRDHTLKKDKLNPIQQNTMATSPQSSSVSPKFFGEDPIRSNKLSYYQQEALDQLHDKGLTQEDLQSWQGSVSTSFPMFSKYHKNALKSLMIGKGLSGHQAIQELNGIPSCIANALVDLYDFGFRGEHIKRWVNENPNVGFFDHHKDALRYLVTREENKLSPDAAITQIRNLSAIGAKKLIKSDADYHKTLC